MSHRTPFCAKATRLLLRRLEAWDRKIFEASDLDALARGWIVEKPRLFVRRYRDPRWRRRPPSPCASGTEHRRSP